MKNPFRFQLTAVAAAAVVFSSCTYDPYYSSSSGYYSSGYGYGYGGDHFSTSFFVSTGDPRWGYDPYCHSYYDYRTRRYYDPYLYGYYPIGYRPPVLIGVPHPYGWSPGRDYIRPPHRIRNITVVNYSNREAAYRRSDYSWARQVRQREFARDRDQYNAPDRSRYIRRQDGNPTPPSYQNRSQNRSFWDNHSSDNRFDRRRWNPDDRDDHRRSDTQITQPGFRERRDDPRQFSYNRQTVTPSPQQTQSYRERFRSPENSRQERFRHAESTRQEHFRSSDQPQHTSPPTFQRENRQPRTSDQDGRTRSTSDEPQDNNGREERRRIRGLGNG